MTFKGEEIKTVKANKKGKFSLDELDLTLYQGKKLKVVAYKRIYDRINDEGGYVAVKTVKFKVQEK